MTSLFDYAASRQARDHGIAAVASYPNDEWVRRAKDWVVTYAAKWGEVSSDDVHRKFGEPPKPNCMGAVFRDKRLKPIGFCQTARVSGRARRIMLYSLHDG